MSYGVFVKGLRLQGRIALSLFISGILIGMLAMSFGVSPRAVSNSSTKQQDLSGPIKEGVERIFSGNNKYSWVYYLFGNGLTNFMFISMFFMTASVKSFHVVKGEPGIFSSAMYKMTGWYLSRFGLQLNSTPSFLGLAMTLSLPSVLGFGFLAFSFGSFSVAAAQKTSLLFYLAAIVPHGIFEIPAALASGAMPLAMLIEIVRQKRENEDADTWQIARQLAFSRFTAIILAVIFALTLTAAIIEGHYSSMIIDKYFRRGSFHLNTSIFWQATDPWSAAGNGCRTTKIIIVKKSKLL